MSDLPRIGPEPDCEHPRCQLLGRTRIIDRLGVYRIVCSLHSDWDGQLPGEANTRIGQ